MMVESFPSNIYLLRCCSFQEINKTSQKYVLHAKIIFVSLEENYFHDIVLLTFQKLQHLNK